MSYRETLDYLYRQLPMYHRIGPAAYKNDLTNTLALCAHLGNPQDKFRSVHVAGTNGKGSVSHLLAAVAQAAGLKTGLYISPHYKDFRERIKINGQYIARQGVVDFIGRHREVIEAIQPSFFELCVAMAFDHFAREHVDLAIIEVGLGGRLDSTNVITPLLSVITNISYDHQHLLGDTLPLIAGEKAGIIKPGVPVVIGETQAESAPVFLARAAAMGSPIVFADQHFTAIEKNGSDWQTTVYDVFRDGKMYLENLEVDAAGPYQARNLATVLQALEELGNAEYGMRNAELSQPLEPARNITNETRGHHPSSPIPHSAFPIPHSLLPFVREGVGRLRELTRFQGRWQVIGQQPTVLCDSAHNEAGLRLAFERINQLPFRRLHVVTGFVNDKALETVLGLYPTEAKYYFAKADIPRALDAGLLREKAAAFQLQGRAYTSVRRALAAARRAAGAEDLVVVIGSIFLVGEVL
ncbi:MAG: Mur ligase family protein [Saprospiraceae bacterium]